MPYQPHACAASTWGAPDAPKKALLIHGLGSSSHTWIDVAPGLVEKGYHVIAPDLLGHGFAPQSDSYQIVDFVNNILSRIGDGRVDLLIGHSLGGPVSLGLYPRLKHKLRRLVLVDPALEVTDARIEGAKNQNLDDVKKRPSPAELLKQEPNWSFNAAAVKSLAVCLASSDAIESIMTKIRPWSFTKILPPVSDGVEIVIMRPDPQKEAAFRPEEVEALAKHRPDIKVMTAIGAGHSIQREQPELIVSAATASLDSLTSALL